MSTVDGIMRQLEALGSEQTRKTFARHGIEADTFGVKVGDLKQVAKAIRGEQALAEDLFATGTYDAMYLAGMVADGRQMNRSVLGRWARGAKWPAIASTAVAWVATESRWADALATTWIRAKRELVATAGWTTLSGIVATRADEDLDLMRLQGLLDEVRETIHAAPNRVRFVMNAFVISVGCYVAPLSAAAVKTAEAIGPVEVDMGDTACQVPAAVAAIEKVAAMGRIGRKRTTIRCA